MNRAQCGRVQMDLRFHVNKIIEDQSQEKTGQLLMELQ